MMNNKSKFITACLILMISITCFGQKSLSPADSSGRGAKVSMLMKALNIDTKQAQGIHNHQIRTTLRRSQVQSDTTLSPVEKAKQFELITIAYISALRAVLTPQQFLEWQNQIASTPEHKQRSTRLQAVLNDNQQKLNHPIGGGRVQSSPPRQ